MDNKDETEQPSTQISAFKKLKDGIEREFGPDVADDNMITRFLIAREYDGKQAYSMLKKNLEWRKKNKIGTILQDYYTTEVFEKYMAFNMIGFDKENHPIFISSLGKMDHKGFIEAVTTEEILRFFMHFYESVEQRVKEHSNKVGGNEIDGSFIIIADTEDLSFMHLYSKIFIERGIELCLMNDANYPERLKAWYIINASKPFQILFSILKPFMALKTLQKIKVYGKDGWKEELLKIIDPQVLPAYLGGEKRDPDGNPMCHSIICHGGPIPERLYMKNAVKSHLKNEPGVKSFVLKRKSRFDLPLEVEFECSMIEWKIETENYDVGFGLSYKEFTSSNEDGDLVPLIPLHRPDSSQSYKDGTFKCDKPGIYILTIDNSYSFFRSKTVYYKVSIIKPEEVKSHVS